MEDVIQKAREILATNNRILVTASNGFSISEGLNLFTENQQFQQLFSDLIPKYHFHSILQALSCSYSDAVALWRVWARVIQEWVTRYQPGVSMTALQRLLQNKDYFIATSNGEHHFQLAGFKDEAVLETEGDWATMRCFSGHHQSKLLSVSSSAQKIFMADEQSELTADDLPRCSECGAVLLPHMVFNSQFIQPEAQQRSFEQLKQKTIQDGHGLTILELGVGQNHPNLRQPIFELVSQAKQVQYIVVN